MSIPVLHDIGAVIMTKNNVIADPGTGNTFNQNGMAYGTAVVGAGTYKLPDNGLPMYVQATGAVVITNAAGTTVATLGSGSIRLFLPASSTTWTTIGGASHGYLNLALNAFRETSTGDVGDTTANGGVLSSNTSPVLEGVAATAAQRLAWATGNVDAVTNSVALPADFDGTQDVLVQLIVAGDVDGFNGGSVITNWGDGANITDAIVASNSSNIHIATATVAAADVNDTPYTMSLTIIPPAHATDTIYLYGARVRYALL